MKEGEKERKRKRDAGRERRNEGWKEYVSNTQHLLYHHLPVALHLQATTSAPRPRRPTCLQPLVRRGGGVPTCLRTLVRRGGGAPPACQNLCVAARHPTCMIGRIWVVY